MIKLNVNNGRSLELTQDNADGIIILRTVDNNGMTENSEAIYAGDFTTMLNWYRYQKDNGNTNLEF